MFIFSFVFLELFCGSYGFTPIVIVHFFLNGERMTTTFDL
jgi:hypothetical protein